MKLKKVERKKLQDSAAYQNAVKAAKLRADGMDEITHLPCKHTQVHHKHPVTLYPDQACNPENLIVIDAVIHVEYVHNGNEAVLRGLSDSVRFAYRKLHEMCEGCRAPAYKGYDLQPSFDVDAEIEIDPEVIKQITVVPMIKNDEGRKALLKATKGKQRYFLTTYDINATLATMPEEDLAELACFNNYVGRRAKYILKKRDAINWAW
jgi:hypothetical protein